MGCYWLDCTGKCSDAAQANCASADAGAPHYTQTGYIYWRQGLPLQDFCLVKINQFMHKCSGLHSYHKISIRCRFESCCAVLSKCKVIHIDTSNNIANIKVIKCTALTLLENMYSCTQTHKQLAPLFHCCTQNYRIMNCL